MTEQDFRSCLKVLLDYCERVTIDHRALLTTLERQPGKHTWHQDYVRAHKASEKVIETAFHQLDTLVRQGRAEEILASLQGTTDKLSKHLLIPKPQIPPH
ncbi:MAG: hypothetical protein WCC87_18320 [Candidatus Korobacteraceae bacterium]